MNKKLLAVVILAMIVPLAGGSIGATAGQLSQAQGAQTSQPPQGAASPMKIESGPLAPVGSGFTYQGRLVVSGSPASGNYDFSFALFDAATGGNQIGILLIDSNRTVSLGTFTTVLDFGHPAFQGDARWLQVGVRPSGTQFFTILSPRQALTPAPYAMSLVPGSSVNGTSGSALFSVTNIGGPSSSAALVGINSAGSGVTGQSSTGPGLYGNSNSGSAVTGVSSIGAGVSGSSTSGAGVSGTSPSLYGVYGDSTNGRGVYGHSSGSGFGVYGNSSSGFGVFGDSATLTGVYGNSNSGTGVAAFSNSGYAVDAQGDGHARQARSGGGWAKALVRVGGGAITRCYNSQVATPNTTVPCGFSITGSGGDYTINFGFQVNDRFVSVTPEYAGDTPVVATVAFPAAAQVRVRTWFGVSLLDSAFMLEVH